MTASLVLDIRWEDDQPVGSVGLPDGSGAPVAFRGWLELAAAVQHLTGNAA